MLYNEEIKRQKAEEIILNPLWNIAMKEKQRFLIEGFIVIPIQLKNRFFIVAGKYNKFRVPSISDNDLEGMLNLLQRYSLLKYESFFCGTAYYVYLRLPRKAESACKVISLNQNKRAA